MLRSFPNTRCLPTKESLLEKGLLVAHLFSLLMAHYRCTTSTTPLDFFLMAHLWCAISIWYTSTTPLDFFSIFFQNFFSIFLNLRSLWLNLGLICLISGQIALHGQTSQKVTHPHTTPAQARLTSEFYPTPATAHFTCTC